MAPTVSLLTVQATVARALRSGLYCPKRVERAAALIAFGAVSKLDADAYAVRSQTDAVITYTVTPDGCDCADAARHSDLRCKHDLAVRILLSAEVAERKAAEQRERAVASADTVALAYARSIGWAA